MPTTITGNNAGVPYDVTVADGSVEGSPSIAALLISREGDGFRETPTDGDVVLDLRDEASVVIALSSLTDVVLVNGQRKPDPTDADAPLDAVF